MAIQRDLDQAQIAFQIVGADADQFQVTRYRGTEGLCQLFRFEVEAVCYEQDLDLDAIVGTRAMLHVRNSFNERKFHGLISRVEVIGESNDSALYRLELSPHLWLLTHRSDCRIFQGRTTKQIIEDVFTAAGLPADSYSLSGISNADVREYCVQYRETDFNFICRLMEADGIWWYFEHTADLHKFVATDSSEQYTAIPDEPEVPYQPPTGMNVIEGEHVFRFRKGHAVRPSHVSLTDYDFENPKNSLAAQEKLERDAGLEFRDYPGEYKAAAAGTTLAGKRVQEFEAARVVATGMADCLRFAPGRKFKLVDYPSASANQEYLLTSVTHQGKQVTAQSGADYLGQSSLFDPNVRQALLAAQQSPDGSALRDVARAVLQIASRLSRQDPSAQRPSATWLFHAGQVIRDLTSLGAGLGLGAMQSLSLPNLMGDNDVFRFTEYDAPTYECRFECVPATAKYRPPRVTPWPVMRGTQTAVVVGPSGEEIHTDAHGRIKVQFHWDRVGTKDDKSSCFIRVGQLLAGGMYGAMFLPRIGHEVIVDFLEGNPDKPIVIGSVYNGLNKPPYALPDNKTRTVIKTNSSKGGGGTNEIRIEDLKDSEQFLINAHKDYHLRVGKAGKGQERHLVEENRSLTVKKEQRTKIDSSYSVNVGAKYAIMVAETYNETVKGDVIQDYKANHGHKVASEYYLKAGSKVIIEGGAQITLKVGGNFVDIGPAGVTIKGTMVLINSGGAAGSGSANQSPAEPAAPEEPDQVEPGKDEVYGPVNEQAPAIAEKTYEGHWVSFDLKDETTGEPCAGEYYEVTLPSGKVVKGALDVNGYARIWVAEAGECQIAYPNRHPDEWQRG